MAITVVTISWTLTVVIRQSLLKKIHRIQLTVLANLQLIAGKALKAHLRSEAARDPGRPALSSKLLLLQRLGSKPLLGHRFITKHLGPRKTPVEDP